MLSKKNQNKMVMKLENVEKKIFDIQKSDRLPIISIITGFVMALGLLMFSFYQFYQFVDNNKVFIQNPISVQFYSPIVIQDRSINMVDSKTKIISPIPTIIKEVQKKQPKPQTKIINKDDIVKSSKFAKFIDHIWVHESGRGTNSNPVALHNKCKAKGMTNEFGFYPQGGWCWESFEEGVARLEKWRVTEAKGLTDSQALCYYNQGVKTNDCAYLGNNFALMN